MRYMANKLVAVVGMCGAGKSDATRLFEAHGWQSVYFGQVTLDEVKREGLPLTPENEKYEREKIRREHGLGAYAMLLEKTISEKLREGNVVLDGLYSWSEYKYLRENVAEDIVLVAVVTDRALRYERLCSRSVRPFSHADAVRRDYTELENLEKGGPIAFADRFIGNNGTKEEFTARVTALIAELEAPQA